MPSYLHPGVYIEEIPSGSKPIEGVSTSTSAFVGATFRGPVNSPTLIGTWDEYIAQFGDFNQRTGLAGTVRLEERPMNAAGRLAGRGIGKQRDHGRQPVAAARALRMKTMQPPWRCAPFIKMVVRRRTFVACWAATQRRPVLHFKKVVRMF